MREVSAAAGSGEADGGLMPIVLRPAPGEGISARECRAWHRCLTFDNLVPLSQITQSTARARHTTRQVPSVMRLRLRMPTAAMSDDDGVKWELEARLTVVTLRGGQERKEGGEAGKY